MCKEVNNMEFSNCFRATFLVHFKYAKEMGRRGSRGSTPEQSDQKTDYYELLGVTRGATDEEYVHNGYVLE
jgi:hypothetical protein